MLALSLFGGDAPVRRVLAIGCHADDIEIGCGGTLLALTRGRPDVEVTWVVLGAEGERAAEARTSAEDFLAGAARSEVVVHGFKDAYMPYNGESVKEAFEQLEAGTAGSGAHPHARRPPPGSSPRVRADVEHVPRPPHPRVRGAEVGRRPRTSQPVRPPRRGRRHGQARPRPPALPDAGGEALVRHRDLPRAHAAPGPRMRRSVTVRRGVLRSEGHAGPLIPHENPRHRQSRLYRLGARADRRRRRPRRRRARHVLLPRVRLRKRPRDDRDRAARRSRRDGRGLRGVRRGRPPGGALQRPDRRPQRAVDVRHQPRRDAARRARGQGRRRPTVRLRVVLLDVRRVGNGRPARRGGAAPAADRLRRVQGARGGGPRGARRRRVRDRLDAQRDGLRRLAAAAPRHRPQQPRRLGAHDRPGPAAVRRALVAAARPRPRPVPHGPCDARGAGRPRRRRGVQRRLGRPELPRPRPRRSARGT